ncbi:MAG: DUF3107 domain-containing protein [Nocardioides sp.]
MEVKIGVQHAPRELIVEVAESAKEIEAQLTAALEKGTLLGLTDAKGRRVLIPVDRIAYVELGGGTAGQVGFRS